jgi:hypothetical protein
MRGDRLAVSSGRVRSTKGGGLYRGGRLGIGGASTLHIPDKVVLGPFGIPTFWEEKCLRKLGG